MSTAPRAAVEVSLRGGPTVVLADLTATEVATAAGAAGRNSKVAEVVAMDIAAEGVRMSLRKVDGADVSYIDVAGDLFKERVPRTRHRLQLSRVWGDRHAPTEAQAEAFKATIEVEDGPAGEIWRATLPDGRKVAMTEPSDLTVREVMEATARGKNEMAGAIAAGRAHVFEVGGQAVQPDSLKGKAWDQHFSAVDTVLVGLLFGEATGLNEAPAVGNLP